MVIKQHYCLLFIVFFISSVISRNIQFNFLENKGIQSTTTFTSERIHLKIHEISYSSEDIHKYINECVQKCMENRQVKSKKNIFGNSRDNCIQLQCRVYE